MVMKIHMHRSISNILNTNVVAACKNGKKNSVASHIIEKLLFHEENFQYVLFFL